MKKYNAAFVTCIYDGYHGTIYGGRPNRKKHYIESLKSISNIGVNIFCFTSEKLYDELVNAFSSNYNIIILKQELNELWFSDNILKIKNSNLQLYTSNTFWQQRNSHIMWAKTEFLRQISIKEQPEYIFWIDAGLSSDQLFPNEYFPTNNRDASIGLFTDALLDHFIQESQMGIISMHHTVPNNAPLPVKYYSDSSKRKSSAMVAGFFGGKTVLVDVFVELFTKYINVILENNELYGEEGIYSTISQEYPDMFNVVLFDSFYHRDWGARHKKDQKIFSDFFEKTTKNEKIIFATLAYGEHFSTLAIDLVNSINRFHTKNVEIHVFTDMAHKFAQADNVSIHDISDHPQKSVQLKRVGIIELCKKIDTESCIIFLDADCFLTDAINIKELINLQYGIWLALGSFYIKNDINNGLVLQKINALVEEHELKNVRAFRECALLLRTNKENVEHVNDFLMKWQDIFTIIDEKHLTHTSECIDITLAASRSTLMVHHLDVSKFTSLNNIKTRYTDGQISQAILYEPNRIY